MQTRSVLISAWTLCRSLGHGTLSASAESDSDDMEDGVDISLDCTNCVLPVIQQLRRVCTRIDLPDAELNGSCKYMVHKQLKVCSIS
jgi:hypothetical protein